MFRSSCLLLSIFAALNIANSELSPLKLSIYYQNDCRTNKYFLLKDLLQYDFLVCKEEGEVRVEVGHFQILKERDAGLEFRGGILKKKEKLFLKVGGLHNLSLS